MTPGNLLQYYDGVEFTRDLIKKSDIFTNEEKEQIVTYGYGHMGDGDIHINLAVPGDNKDLLDRLNGLV